MERQPEPDLMNTIEQARAYAETDFSEPHNDFVRQFARRFPRFKDGNVLDLGCGTADVIIRFAKAFPDVHITGIDGAEAMLEIAMQEVRKSAVAPRVTLQKCFIPDYSLPEKKYDAIISNSLLHHLLNPCFLWETIKKSAGYNATVFVMDLFRPESPEAAKEIVEKHSDGASPLLQKDFYNSLLAAYSKEEILDQLKAARMEHLEVEIISDRHVIIWGNVNG